MDPTLRAALAISMRWIHIASVVALIGGFVYARFVLAPALASLPTAERELVGSKTVSSFRPLLITVLVTVIGSGMYNYLTKTSYPPTYNIWMGIKLLSCSTLPLRPSSMQCAARVRPSATEPP